MMFTQFIEDEEDFRLLDPSVWPDCSYCIYQVERSPQTGSLHFQGYVELVGQKRFEFIHNNYDGLETAHLEVRRGSQAQAVAYCSKVDSKIEGPWEWGERKLQGQRMDLQGVKRAIDNGMGMDLVADSFFPEWCRFNKAFETYKRIKTVKRNWPMDIVIYVGPTRSGKSREAARLWPDAYWLSVDKWWQDYKGEETVILDEFYGSVMPFKSLLKLMDRYPMQVENKGGSCQFVSRRLVFTSNQEPEFWYDRERTHQMDWEHNPLNARIREFGRIIRTGVIHQLRPAVPALVDVANREYELQIQNLFYYDNNE